MSHTTIPAALIILVDDKAYMTVRDWIDADEHHVNPGGIDILDNYFGDPDSAADFKKAVSSSTGFELDKIMGTMVRPTDVPTDELPRYPSLCTFRVAASGHHYIARWFAPLGIALGQNFSVFALLDGECVLLDQYRNAIDAYRKWLAGEITKSVMEAAMIPHSTIRDAVLTPVYSSVTLTKDEVGDNSDGNADGGGDGFG